jgi:hypothetical protein
MGTDAQAGGRSGPAQAGLAGGTAAGADVDSVLAGPKTSRQGLTAQEAARPAGGDRAERDPGGAPQPAGGAGVVFLGADPVDDRGGLHPVGDLAALGGHDHRRGAAGVQRRGRVLAGAHRRDAVAALKSQLALRAMACRDGAWTQVDAAALVPGDVVRTRLGDIIPADVVLLDGEYLRVDQSALTIVSRSAVGLDPGDRGRERLQAGGVVGNTPAAMGRPCRSVSSPYPAWRWPRLPSRECPKAASSQHEPSTQDEDRPDMARPSLSSSQGIARRLYTAHCWVSLPTLACAKPSR